MLYQSGISPETYDAILTGWSEQNLQNNVTMYAGGLMYCESLNERSRIISEFQWVISGDEHACPSSVITGPVESVSSQEASVLINVTTPGGSIYSAGVEYGLNTSYGAEEQSSLNSTGEHLINVHSNIRCGTTYHYRAYSTNARGTAYGEDATFTTTACPDYSLSVSHNNIPPIVSGNTVQYDLTAKNLGSSSSTISAVYFYIIIPENTTYQSASFVAANPNSYCMEYGLASSLPYESFSSYNGTLVVCLVMPQQALATGDAISIQLSLVTTADFIPGSTTLRGLITGPEDSEADVITAAIVGTTPLYSISSNNVFNHVYTLEEDITENPYNPPEPIISVNPSDPPVGSSSGAVEKPPEPIEYLKEMARKGEIQKEEAAQQSKKRVTAVAVITRNLSWILLVIMALFYAIQAYRQERQNHLLRVAETLLNQTTEGLSGFLRIVTHYLGTPVTTMSLAIESLVSNKQNMPTRELIVSSESLKEYVNNLVNELNKHAEPIKQQLDSTGKIKHNRITLWVMLPVLVSIGLLALSMVLAAQSGWQEAGLSLNVLGLLLVVTGSLLTLLFFKFWQHQRQLNANLKQTQVVARSLLEDRVEFIASNQKELGAKVEEVRKYCEGISDPGFIKHFTGGADQLSSVSITFGHIANLLRTNKPAGTSHKAQISVGSDVAKFQSVASQAHIQLSYEGAPHVVVPFTSQEFEFITGHLIDNALRFTPGGGQVYVSAKNKRRRFIMTVGDTGKGIDHKKISTLMQPFTRATSTETYDYEGLGLSLYTVRLIVEKYGGSVNIVSHEGKGTVVQITV